MPSLENESTSWADDVEESEEPSLPPNEEKVLPNGTKIVTEYRFNEDDKKEKVVTTIKMENRKVSKEVAKRKVLPKFGLSKGDKPGPNTATTIMAEEVTMQFIMAHEEEKDDSDDMRAKLKEQNKGQIKCRYCKGDHWTTQCPYKEIGGLDEAKEAEDSSKAASASTGGKYVPPFMKEGAKMRGESMMGARGRDDYATVRVTNLSESTRESDLEDLFRPFGSLSRTFLAKDKQTGLSKGFAFISFHRQESAEQAIEALNGFGYDHLILKVEWSKPSEK